MKITPANITFNEQGTPTSDDFGDVYFSNHDGLAETEYVFLQGNRLLERWKNHSLSHFCIGETGFGTGLNFFCTAALFNQFKQQHPHSPLQDIYFISTEKHPIESSQIKQVLAKWPVFETYTQQWLARYPVSVDGIHRVHFKNGIHLDLHYNDAGDAFDSIYSPPQGLVDAWFLDGFAPSKNTAMWTQQVFNAMARLSTAHASLATFTAAGFVKRGLIEAGFAMRKQKGFGRKREMLVGELQTHSKLSTSKYSAASPPYFQRFALEAELYSTVHNTADAQTASRVCVTGNGLAGAIMALKLVQQGIKVDLIWSGNNPADAASGALIGGFYPQLNAQNNHASRLQVSSFLYAKNFYNDLHQQSPFAHSWCGALQLGFNQNTQVRLNKLNSTALWPAQIAHYVSPQAASDIAHVDIPYPSLFMPLAGWISPHSLVNACIDAALQSGNLNLIPNTTLLSFDEIEENQQQSSEMNKPIESSQASQKVAVKLINANKESSAAYAALVIATGSGSQALLSPLVPLRLTRGQIELVESTGTLSHLQTLICHKGYLTPALNGFHALGSSYIKNDKRIDIRQAETEQNFAMHIKSMQEAAWVNEFEQLQAQPKNHARAAVRCSSPDHFPVVGAMPSSQQLEQLASLYKALPVHHYQVPSVRKNVYVLSGLGSRGLTTAPLMAELLLCEMLNRPLPLPLDLLNALMPNRFIVRSLIRRQALQA